MAIHCTISEGNINYIIFNPSIFICLINYKYYEYILPNTVVIYLIVSQ